MRCHSSGIFLRRWGYGEKVDEMTAGVMGEVDGADSIGR